MGAEGKGRRAFVPLNRQEPKSGAAAGAGVGGAFGGNGLADGAAAALIVAPIVRHRHGLGGVEHNDVGPYGLARTGDQNDRKKDGDDGAEPRHVRRNRRLRRRCQAIPSCSAAEAGWETGPTGRSVHGPHENVAGSRRELFLKTFWRCLRLCFLPDHLSAFGIERRLHHRPQAAAENRHDALFLARSGANSSGRSRGEA